MYGPNTDSPHFFENLQKNVEELENPSIIMCGDWNAVIDYELDTRNYLRKNNPKAQKMILDMIDTLDLCDIYRIQNPHQKMYTWHKRPENKQARLDFFLVSSDLSVFVEKIDTVAGYRSDHSLVIMRMNFTNHERGRGYWKFNNSLLYDNIYVNKVKKCITETVDEYKTSGKMEDAQSSSFDIDDHLLFETMVINM